MQKNKQTRANQSKNMQTSQERVKTKVKNMFFKEKQRKIIQNIQNFPHGILKSGKKKLETKMKNYFLNSGFGQKQCENCWPILAKNDFHFWQKLAKNKKNEK